MKKLILTAIFFAVSFPLFPQQQSDDLTWGFKGGLSIMQLSKINSYSTINLNLYKKEGFFIGGYIDLIKKGNFSVSPSVFFKRNIISAEYPNINLPNKPYKCDSRLDQLNFSLSAKYMMFTKILIPYIIVEPCVKIYLGDELYNSDVDIPQSIRDFTSDRYKKIGFGTNVGLGTGITRGNSYYLFVEALYCAEFYYAYQDYASKIRNNTIEIRFGCKF